MLENSTFVAKRIRMVTSLFIDKQRYNSYEMITGYDSLDISPEEGDFYKIHEFYSHLKDDVMTEDEYNNV